MEDIFKDYNYEKEYYCSEYTKAKYFSKLMYLIINVNNIPDGKNILREYIIKNRDEINLKNSIGRTALLIATRNIRTYNIFDETKMLIENGADVDTTDKDGATALMSAAANSNLDSSLEAVKLLVAHGANINVRDSCGATALIYAAKFMNTKSSPETVDYLIKNGADPNLQDDDGYTALIHGVRCPNVEKNYETIKNLAKLVTKIDTVDIMNFSALMHAALIGADSKIMKLLIDHGANPYLKRNGKDKIFFRYISSGDQLIEMIEYISIINFPKIAMKKVLRNIPLMANHILLNPNSIRSQLLDIKWKITKNSNTNLFDELIKEKSLLMNYFGIYGNESLITKITDYVKFME